MFKLLLSLGCEVKFDGCKSCKSSFSDGGNLFYADESQMNAYYFYKLYEFTKNFALYAVLCQTKTATVSAQKVWLFCLIKKILLFYKCYNH